jgi:hypothetical protein
MDENGKGVTRYFKDDLVNCNIYAASINIHDSSLKLISVFNIL